MNFTNWLENREEIGDVYWGPYSFVTEENGLLKITADDLPEPLYVPVQNNVTNIGYGPLNKNISPPWVKYFKYRNEMGKNIITYAENRAVDCIPFDILPRLKSGDSRSEWNEWFLAHRQ